MPLIENDDIQYGSIDGHKSVRFIRWSALNEYAVMFWVNVPNVSDSSLDDANEDNNGEPDVL